MTDFKTAAAYIRVSTEDQVELSPASQLVEIRKWGAANGYLVPDEFVFVDEAKSGRKVTGRDDFRRLIATAVPKAGSNWSRGDRVFHQKFGYGAVRAIEGNKLVVAFDKAGEKKVIDSFVEKAS